MDKGALLVTDPSGANSLVIYSKLGLGCSNEKVIYHTILCLVSTVLVKERHCEFIYYSNKQIFILTVIMGRNQLATTIQYQRYGLVCKGNPTFESYV